MHNALCTNPGRKAVLFKPLPREGFGVWPDLQTRLGPWNRDREILSVADCGKIESHRDFKGAVTIHEDNNPLFFACCRSVAGFDRRRGDDRRRACRRSAGGTERRSVDCTRRSDRTGCRVPDRTNWRVPDRTGWRVSDRTNCRVSDRTGSCARDRTRGRVPGCTGRTSRRARGHLRR